jgi:hypothetical protein
MALSFIRRVQVRRTENDYEEDFCWYGPRLRVRYWHGDHDGHCTNRVVKFKAKFPRIIFRLKGEPALI